MPLTSYPVTQLLTRWGEGDLAARDALVPLVYDELRRIARRSLASRGADHTLQPTALVHEAYLRMVRQDSVTWSDRLHFFATAALMMRQILVDYARRAASAKRGSNPITIALEGALESRDDCRHDTAIDFIALDRAMSRLADLDARQCKIVELRFFGGLSIEETARAVDISPATAKREWATARVWLHRSLTNSV